MLFEELRTRLVAANLSKFIRSHRRWQNEGAARHEANALGGGRVDRPCLDPPLNACYYLKTVDQILYIYLLMNVVFFAKMN